MKFTSLPKFPWLKVYILITVSLFLLRVIILTNSAGIEHDSGWFLGVARNLAERGIYASYTNTVATEGKGAYPSIHGRYSVQDSEGFTYFPAAISVGPGYVVPEAIILKIFGNGWWQYRLWPLVTYGLLLIVLFFIVISLGGVFSLLILQIWLWAYPQLTINFSFEAYGEHIALLYLLTGFWLFVKSRGEKNHPLLIFASGAVISFSILTKNLFALAVPVFVPLAIRDFVENRKLLSQWFYRWGIFILGLILPILAFEVYRYLFVVTKFGQLGYKAINLDRQMHLEMNGSGLDSFLIKNFDPVLAFKKLLVWSEIGINGILLPWLLFLFSPVVLMPFIEKRKRGLIFLLYGSALVSFGWFIFVSPNGWGRYAFQEIFIALILFSVIMGTLARTKKFYRPAKVGFLLIFLLLFVPTIIGSKTNPNFILTRESLNQMGWWSTLTASGIQGFPHVPIFPLKNQQEVVSFFEKNIKTQDRVYYEGWYLVAEIPPLVDKVFYPLKRYRLGGKIQSGESYLIYGPYQKGEFRIVPDNYLSLNIQTNCEKIVFNNPSYTLCLLK